MKLIKSGITQPKGFKAEGLCCGIKRSGKPDLALIVSENPAIAAGVFTKNSIKAAPVIVTQKNIRNNKAQAIIVNSGNANCFTGKLGYEHAKQSAIIVAEKLNIAPAQVLVSSTGIIGKQLPFKKIKKAIQALVKGLSKSRSHSVAKAILTTDKKTKEIAVTVTLGGKKVTLAACAKGSGMVAPNMATMLAFITTDAAINAKILKIALKSACDDSFNGITIDGCMSTNDMTIVLANGQAKNKQIKSGGKDYKTFCNALTFICRDLAKKMVLDAEGATKFITINIAGAKTNAQARKIGLTVANSNLVKTAAFGSNPNWGRVAAAVGSLGIKKINEKSIKITFSPFTKKVIIINVGLNLGKKKATVYTSDLSYEYVRINEEYN